MISTLPRIACCQLATPGGKGLMENKTFLKISIVHTVFRTHGVLYTWGPLPGGGQGGRPPPPDFGGQFFNTFRPPDFGGFCSEMY